MFENSANRVKFNIVRFGFAAVSALMCAVFQNSLIFSCYINKVSIYSDVCFGRVSCWCKAEAKFVDMSLRPQFSRVLYCVCGIDILMINGINECL